MSKEQASEHEDDALVLEHRKAQYAWSLKSADAVLEFARLSVRGLFLINGGAIIALLAFAGSVWGNTNASAVVTGLFPAVLLFVGGLASAVAVGMVSYMAQSCFLHDRNLPGFILQGVAVLCSIISLGAFCFGALLGLHAFILSP